MKYAGNLAVIGSGPTSLYLLKHLLDEVVASGRLIRSVTIFEKEELMGYGMPFHPKTTDKHNLSNISSEEIPELPETFHHWLLKRDSEELADWGIEKLEISETAVYGRLALGCYLRDQYRIIVAGLRAAGIEVHERPNCLVVDIDDLPSEGHVTVTAGKGQVERFDAVVIASGHEWDYGDRPKEGFYSSPWPIFKLLPKEGEFHNFVIGTLGASLSAFDVVSSLAHRHGEFVRDGNALRFQPHKEAQGFRLALHSADGLLPHLQWDQVEPLREIYRYVTPENLLALCERPGILRMATFFDRVCRPALQGAFRKDGITEMEDLLDDDRFGIQDFVEEMVSRHKYVDSFEGMRLEMVEARDSVELHHPIHWKETLDDLMYCLNFHAELIPAEDQWVFRKKVMPFLMNVIAAMPLSSGETLLALHEAGVIELVKGRVTVENAASPEGNTMVSLDQDGVKTQICYEMFVDCSGHKPMDLDEFPFPSLVSTGAVREARAAFANAEESENASRSCGDKVIWSGGAPFLRTGGIEVDAAYRIVGEDGKPNMRIRDLASPHTSGIRPYSYGLQACEATAAIVVRSWAKDLASEKLQRAMAR